MPELPEVELAVRALKKFVLGRRIVKAQLLLQRTAPDLSPRQFASKLRGARIESIGRRGKYILFTLDSHRVLMAHLRMTGKFLYVQSKAVPPKHTHAIFHLDNRHKLLFKDLRQFGFMKIVSEAELFETKELKPLAPEPFSEEFSPAYLRSVLANSRRKLKEFLLDQTKITGLGNIYVSEALFLAQINPFIEARELSARRLPRLHKAIRDVLADSIEAGSTDDPNPESIDGSYRPRTSKGRWKMYGREGKPCPRCGTPIRRKTLAARSTYYCPRCQRR